MVHQLAKSDIGYPVHYKQCRSTQLEKGVSLDKLKDSVHHCIMVRVLGQTDTVKAVRLEMVELLGDQGEGVGGRKVEILNGRGEYFLPELVQHKFYLQ